MSYLFSEELRNLKSFIKEILIKGALQEHISSVKTPPEASIEYEHIMRLARHYLKVLSDIEADDNKQWIEHDGGIMPVDPNALVEIIWSDGGRRQGYYKAAACSWLRKNDSTIKYYRVVGKVLTKKETEQCQNS